MNISSHDYNLWKVRQTSLPKPRKKRFTGYPTETKRLTLERTKLVRETLGDILIDDKIAVRVRPGTPNDTERRYLDMLATLCRRKEIAGYLFASVRLRVGVGACWYTPDIVIRHNDRSYEVVEVKGWRWATGISKVKSAAYQFPEWKFRIATWTKSGWQYEELSNR